MFQRDRRNPVRRWSSQAFPDLHVHIEDMIAEDDKVVVRNHRTVTDSQTGKKLEFRGIVIWRIAARKTVKRWAYLEAPRAVSWL